MNHARLILYFFILFALSGWVHYFYKKSPPTATSDGSIVMAIGIFSLDALQTMPFNTQGFIQLITLEVSIIWLFLIGNYIKQFLNGDFVKMIQDPFNQFGIGTWVAGSCVLAMLFLQEFPSLTIIAWISSVLALIIWLVYIVISIYNLGQFQVHTGIILLPTVATQSLILLAYSLFTTTIPVIIYQTLIMLGYLLYLIGFFIIVRHILNFLSRNIILSWHNTNSILHGALSISGLASITTQSFNDSVILYTWFLATGFLILNEGISFIKCVWRLKQLGFVQGILVYDGSQWARVFTFGMYYAFNRALLAHQIYSYPWIKQIAFYGQYGVLIILLFELFNYFYNQFDFQKNQFS